MDEILFFLWVQLLYICRLDSQYTFRHSLGSSWNLMKELCHLKKRVCNSTLFPLRWEKTQLKDEQNRVYDIQLWHSCVQSFFSVDPLKGKYHFIFGRRNLTWCFQDTTPSKLQFTHKSWVLVSTLKALAFVRAGSPLRQVQQHVKLCVGQCL